MSQPTSPTGHLGNLTAEQVYKLKEFYVALYTVGGLIQPDSIKIGGKAPEPEKKGGRFGFGAKKVTAADSVNEGIDLMKQALGSVKPSVAFAKLRIMAKADNPDAVALRFLRARKWDVAKAVEMFAKTLHWRTSEKDIEDMLAKGEKYWIETDPDEGFINQFKSGKSILQGHDKTGRPLVIITVRKHDPRAQSEEAMERYTLFCIESAHLCLNEQVETAAVVFDLGGFGLHNMDYAVVKFILQCFEAHYPESLGFLFIHRAPWVFSTVWNIIKGWIDPVVASKISFTKNEKDLLKLIDSEQLPRDLGGSSNTNYEWIEPNDSDDKPMLDTKERDELLATRNKLWDELEKDTIQWIQADGAEADSLFKKRHAIGEDLTQNYWKLDPYVRSRSVYDRNGELGRFHKELAPGGVSQPLIK